MQLKVKKKFIVYRVTIINCRTNTKFAILGICSPKNRCESPMNLLNLDKRFDTGVIKDMY